MEPISLSAAAIATLLLTKALEKTGETIGEKGLELVGKLRQLLKRKSPEIAATIEAVTQTPTLAEANPEKYSTQVLVEQLQKIASADPEIEAAITLIAKTINAQPQNMQQNLTTIANKIGVVAPGSVFTGDFNL